MNIAEIENNLQKIIKPFNEDTFIYDLLMAYGQPKASKCALELLPGTTGNAGEFHHYILTACRALRENHT